MTLWACVCDMYEPNSDERARQSMAKVVVYVLCAAWVAFITWFIPAKARMAFSDALVVSLFLLFSFPGLFRLERKLLYSNKHWLFPLLALVVFVCLSIFAHVACKVPFLNGPYGLLSAAIALLLIGNIWYNVGKRSARSR